MEFQPFYHEAEVALSDDFSLKMVMDIAAVDRLEKLFKRSIDEIVVEALQSVSAMAKVLWSVTREVHDNLGLDQLAGLLLPRDPKDQPRADAIATTLGDLLRRALNIAEKVEAPKKKRRRG